MTHKDKAEELFYKFNKDGLHQISSVINKGIRKQIIKQCAIIAVDEIMETILDCSYDCQGRGSSYWDKVKIEIEKL
jgi:hypothetical protein